MIRLLRNARDVLLAGLALIWRKSLPNTRVIAITGSAGKTMAKECLAAILSQRFPTIATIGSSNGRVGIPRTVLRTRPSDRFLIVEVGIQRPGVMWRSALLLRPDMTLMLSVDDVHPEGFSSLDIVAAEKAKLLAPLSKQGIAVLNGDDSRVAAMAANGPFQTILFGTSPNFGVWAGDIFSTWPDRLSFRVHANGQSAKIQTKLVGTHWVPSVLAAITTALLCGVSLEEAAAGVATVDPFPGRMQPVDLPGGAVMLRDEFNGSAPTAKAAARVLQDAKARRKLIVFGSVYEGPGTSKLDITGMAQTLAAVATVGIAVGGRAELVCRAFRQAGMTPENVYQADSLPHAAELLRRLIQPGDLILLRGTWDWHLSRLYFAQLAPVHCWITDCQITTTCDTCNKLHRSPPPGVSRAAGS